MKVFVPYTEIQPATLECLKPYEYTAVKMVEETDYQRYCEQRWVEGESFITIEHDTAFKPEAIEELENCPEEWCAFGVTGNQEDQSTDFTSEPPTLALMKIGRGFIEKCSDMWGGLYPRQIPWKWCDSWLAWYARTNGLTCHRHYPNVVNANPRYTVEELEGEKTVETIAGGLACVHPPTVTVESNILDENGERK